MKTLYLDCGMGAAGDMLTAALLELLPDQESFLAELNALGIPGVEVKKELSAKCGITGTRIIVTVNGEEEEAGDLHGHQHHHEHNHSHSHDHEHEHEQNYCHEHDNKHIHSQEQEHESDCDYHHKHNHSHSHDHEHKHEHEHNLNDAHNHNHEQTHNAGHTHHHRGMQEIEHIVTNLNLSPKVKTDILAVYTLIAEAESHAHGVPVTEIHFHEVGTMDAIADITAVCLLMDKIAPQQVIASPVHTGSGYVRCAHGFLPVPAPATAYILRDVPIYGGEIKGELCTPTGAALLKHFVTSFGNMPVMKIGSIGYGMGKKDFEAVNCVRALLGETTDRCDRILELNCNVDDMTAEEIGFATDRLFDAGALEVFTVPVGMKKSRPGTLISVQCREQHREAVLKAVFKYTTTIGIREIRSNRYVLERSITPLKTPYGEVRRKDSVGYGVSRSKYEYDDLTRIAKEKDLGIAEVIRLIEKQQ